MDRNRSTYSALAELLGDLPSKQVNTLVPPHSNPWESALAALSGPPSPPSGLFSTIAATPVIPGFNLAAFSALAGTTTLPTLSSVWATPLSVVPVATPTVMQWAFVRERFDQLINNIGIQQSEIDDGLKKLGRLIASLNRWYYSGESSEMAHSVIIGSWAKQTRVRPFSDIDVVFILPYDVYLRFEDRTGNKQSQILQELRTNLKGSTYPRTEIVGDRHVVIVEVDGVTIEVVPAFLLTDGRYWVCDTKDEGRYKLADPAAELQALQVATTSNENARQLTRMLKKWQLHKDVPIKAFQLERLAIEFLAQWPYRMHDRFWYDWMVRDFFVYMLDRADGWVRMPGTDEWIQLGSSWLNAAKRASLSAGVACIHERANSETLAGRAWGEIFGDAVPTSVS
jgi:Second Messenger Oligonucleotide or Dinucleotide Synthetase domain